MYCTCNTRFIPSNIEMTNVVVGNGIHLPSLVVSTVGEVLSPTVLDATDSVSLPRNRFPSRSSGFHRGSGRSCYRNTRLKATLHILRGKCINAEFYNQSAFHKLSLSILQRYFVSLIMLANSIVAVRSSLSKHVTYICFPIVM